MNREGLTLLKTDIRKQKNLKREYRHLWIIQWSALWNQVSYFWRHAFKISKNLIASAFFFLRQILKNIDMPRQKPRHLLTAEANFKRWIVWKNLKSLSAAFYSWLFWIALMTSNYSLYYFDIRQLLQPKQAAWISG